jgi:hypothetical protein
MDSTTRRNLWGKLIQAKTALKALNRKRGPLGHGVIHHANKAEESAALQAEIQELSRQLGLV